MSPVSLTLEKALEIVKSFISNPFFTSSQCKGIETVVPGLGRKEYGAAIEWTEDGSAEMQGETDFTTMQLMSQVSVLVFNSSIHWLVRFISSLIPDNNSSSTIFAFRNKTFKIFIVVRVVFNHHGKPLHFRICGRSFWNCPAFQYPAHLQSEIIMKM